MLCNVKWVVSCTRDRGGGKVDGASEVTDLTLGKCSRTSVAWTLGAASSNKLSNTKLDHIVKVRFCSTCEMKCNLSVQFKFAQHRLVTVSAAGACVEAEP